MMQYFELFGEKPSFKTDPSILKKKFYALSRELHPDFNTSGSEEEQMVNLEKAAQLNKAYKTLLDPDATIGYILECKGLLETEKQAPLPPDFLMEMMDINEALADAEMEGNTTTVEQTAQQITALEKTLYETVEKDLDADPEDPAAEKALLRVKDYYLKKKYLQRILDRIAGIRNIAAR